MPTRRPPRPANEFHAAWAQEVTKALAERGLSVHAAARRAGISPGALQAWLHQGVEPDPRRLAALASVVGRRHLHLMYLLGWLPDDLDEATLLELEATEKLQAGMDEARRWVEAATAVAGFSGGVRIAHELLRASEDWEVTLRRSIRGSRHRAHFATHIALSRVGPPSDPHQPSTRPADTTADREEIAALIPEGIRRTGAYWRPVERTRTWHWVKRPDLVLTTPVLLASKPRGLEPDLAVPPSILVVGVPYVGAADIGALLASALDWAYTDVVIGARERLGLPDPLNDSAMPALSDMARQLLRSPLGAGRYLVWSHNAAKALLETFKEPRDFRGQLPLIVYVKAPPSMFEFIEAQYSFQPQRSRLEVAEIAQVQRLVERRLRERDPGTCLTLCLPELELPIDRADPHDVDRLFDAAVELAFDASGWLHEQHRGPPPSRLGGILGRLWRAAHPEAATSRPGVPFVPEYR